MYERRCGDTKRGISRNRKAGKARERWFQKSGMTDMCEPLHNQIFRGANVIGLPSHFQLSRPPAARFPAQTQRIRESFSTSHHPPHHLPTRRGQEEKPIGMNIPYTTPSLPVPATSSRALPKSHCTSIPASRFCSSHRTFR